MKRLFKKFSSLMSDPVNITVAFAFCFMFIGLVLGVVLL